MKLFSKKKSNKNVEKKDTKDSNLKKCKHCDMRFDDDERLRRHVRKAHNESNGDMPNLNPFGPS
ncbi:hypothetical protein [Candidatus Nitrosocosmicus hydrocola]|jgi:hypothetical protein|uniref:hypothetical protein n=1 Tax=Candidatus Nitrosocosmicus hydrocola TaxID=1826872 RepID=UPI0011E5EECF|nr:hypothetical protein [Candidatus Nitrosocosmicus hydrocola]